jgi:nitrile hydratase accessory protein
VTSRVDAAVTALCGPLAPPRRNGELVFEAPWQGRAFGMALAVVERLGLEWRTFQEHLIAEIAAHPEAPYYDCWVAALERLVLAQGLVSADELSGARERMEA